MSPRILLLGILFVAVALGLAIAGHAYLFWGLVARPAWPPLVGTALTVLGAALFATWILQPIAERRLRPSNARRALAWVAYGWMGLCWYLVLLLGVTDLLGLLLPLPATPRAIGVLVVAGVLGYVGVGHVRRPPALESVEVRLDRWPRALDGYRVLQITDLHIGPILGRAWAAAVTRRVNELAPDLVAVTGDLADGSAAMLADEVAPLSELAAPDGVYFVTGNHELISHVGPWVERARSLGFRVLRNEHVVVERAGARFVVAGVNDHSGVFYDASEAEDVAGALAGVPEEAAVLLLAHDPNTFKVARRHPVDLQISGHTHAGQLWPFRFLVRLVIRWVDGLHRDASGAAIYVSRGTGFWGPPMRVGAPAEITELILRSGGAA